MYLFHDKMNSIDYLWSSNLINSFHTFKHKCGTFVFTQLVSCCYTFVINHILSFSRLRDEPAISINRNVFENDWYILPNSFANQRCAEDDMSR